MRFINRVLLTYLLTTDKISLSVTDRSLLPVLEHGTTLPEYQRNILHDYHSTSLLLDFTAVEIERHRTNQIVLLPQTD